MGQNTEDQSGGYCSSGERLLWLHLDRRADSDGKGTRLDVDTVSKIQPQCLLLERLCGLREGVAENNLWNFGSGAHQKDKSSLK